MPENNMHVEREAASPERHSAGPPRQPNESAEASRPGGPVFVIWGDINDELLARALRFAKTTGRLSRLNLLIQSDGGYANAGFSCANVLAGCCDQLVVYIPKWAKSASTLLCLRAHEIVLSLGAQLGPLDTQVPDPENEERYVSALKGFEALRAMTDFLQIEFNYVTRQIMRQCQVTAKDSLASAIRFLDVLAAPILAQLRIQDLGTFKRALDTSALYARMLLERRNVDRGRADRIAKELVYGYPSHGFAIDIVEAKRIGLPAREPSAAESSTVDSLYVGLTRRRGRDEYYGTVQWNGKGQLWLP